MISSAFYLATVVFSIIALATDDTQTALIAIATLIAAFVAAIREER